MSQAVVTDGGMVALFGGVYAGRRVLVTGHTGFKGSWLVMWLQAMGANVCAIALPSTSNPAHHNLLALKYDAELLDIRNGAAVSETMRAFAPEIVFHLAAQALVRESYAAPQSTFDVNVMGLVNVLEAVRATPSVRAVINVTSDKCYRQDGSPNAFAEDAPLGGHDPYSASKACAEIVSASYRDSFLGVAGATHAVALATVRAGNVIGGGDWSADRLIPDLARAASSGCTVPIRNPNAVRPWQHVLEPLSGYLLLGQQLLQSPKCAERFASAWNFGPSAEGHLTVAEVVCGFSAHWSSLRTETDTSAQPHEAAMLHLDCTKARHELGWQPVWNSAVMLQRTAAWYRAWYEQGELRTHSDFHEYIRDARALNLPWAVSR